MAVPAAAMKAWEDEIGMYPAGKTNGWKLKITCFEEENNLPNLLFFGSMFRFSGVYLIHLILPLQKRGSLMVAFDSRELASFSSTF